MPQVLTINLDDAMYKPCRSYISIFPLLLIALAFMFDSIYAEMPLELIQVFQGEADGVSLAKGCFSPGDLDGDGFYLCTPPNGSVEKVR
jgi:hypothetical protein